MNIKQLQPASQLAQRFGVKSLIYGGPGTGKTPMVQSTPSPVMCVVEPGMLSMRNVTNVPAWEANTPEKIEEFFTWTLQSTEAKNFQTVCIDSISQLCEVFLTQELARCKHGLQAYGEMSRRVMSLVDALYYMPEKHIYLIAKQAVADENNVAVKKPYFPGKDLNIKIPHLFDEILHIGETNVPGQPKPVLAIRTKATFNITARDRSGKLDELEQPNIGAIFTKCMS